MRSRITIATALALGTALTAAPALAQVRQPAPSYSNTGPYSGAPLSPGGISAAASSFGGPGPGYIGPSGGGATAAKYSNTGPYSGAPLSPGGISAAASSFGGPGPGYIGPGPGRLTPSPSYSNTRASGAPLSPNGISAAASSYGGPGYQGN